MCVKCKDHLGNEYNSMKEMCNAYNIQTNTVMYRLNKGMSLKMALEGKEKWKHFKNYYDHLGNEYNSMEEMCDAYNVKRKTVSYRLNCGVSLEEALTSRKYKLKTSSSGIECTDHLGNKYKSYKDMCDAYGIAASNLTYGLKRGRSLVDILESRNKSIERRTDTNGIVYETVNEMCNAYGISTVSFRRNLMQGMSVKDALCNIKYTCTDHLGNKYRTIREMCRTYSISEDTFKRRISRGWSVERALTNEARERSIKCKDHYGNEYNSISDMCSAYNVSIGVFEYRIKAGWSLEKALETKVR